METRGIYIYISIISYRNDVVMITRRILTGFRGVLGYISKHIGTRREPVLRFHFSFRSYIRMLYRAVL